LKVKLLLDYGADYDCKTYLYKSTPFHFAAFNGHLECIKVRKKTKYKYMLFPSIRQFSHFLFCFFFKILLDKGMYIDVRDAKELTPLHYAVKKEQLDCIEFLIKQGADVEAEDYKGRKWSDMNFSEQVTAVFEGKRPRRGSIPKIVSRENGKAPIVVNEEEEAKLYSNLDKYGFMVEEKEKDGEGGPDKDKEKEDKAELNTQVEIARALKWKRMMDKWEETIKKDLKKVRSRCEKGIPPRVRGQAWRLLAQSTPEQLPERKLNYREFLSSTSEHETQILKDINRTFPKHILLMKKGGQEALFNVLKANAVYNKKVGYCQGMGFVTALLLMYMEEEVKQKKEGTFFSTFFFFFLKRN
jgi:hypothetical protein